MLTLLRRYPLLSFFLLAYGLNFALSLPLLAIPFAQRWPVLWLIPGATPTISAILVSACLGGMPEVKRLLSGWLKFNLGWHWYLAAFTFVLGPLLVVLVYIALGNAPRGLSESATPLSLLGSLLFIFFGAPFGEEAGWRGFALPRLQQRFTALQSSLILGVVWTFWHLPFYIDPQVAARHIPLPIFLVICIVLSILFTWIYNNTHGSLVGVMLSHFCFNFTGTFLVGHFGLVPQMMMYITGGVMLGTWALLVVLFAGAKTFIRRPAITEA